MAHTGISEWHWLWQEVRPFVRYQAASLLCILSASFVSLVDPRLMKWLIDDPLPHRRLGALAVAAGLFFAVCLGRLVLSSGGKVITFFAIQRLTYRLRVRLLDHLEALSCGFYADAADIDRVPLLPLFVFVRHRYRMFFRRVSDDVREAMGRQSRVLNEILTGVTQIQLLGAERRVSRRYARLNRVAIVGKSGCGRSSL